MKLLGYSYEASYGFISASCTYQLSNNTTVVNMPSFGKCYKGRVSLHKFLDIIFDKNRGLHHSIIKQLGVNSPLVGRLEYIDKGIVYNVGLKSLPQGRTAIALYSSVVPNYCFYSEVVNLSFLDVEQLHRYIEKCIRQYRGKISFSA